ncbi:MAG: UvrD-helicase domain-containing protein [Alistipes sp.]
MRAKILNASAGSGKTYQLAYKYVHDVVEQPTLYRHILAVTFTNKATEEMKTRILSEIHHLASGGTSRYLQTLCDELTLDEATVRLRARDVRTRILHDYSHFTILTIDTFFQRILRAFIKELGLDLNYNIELENSSMLAKSADTLIEEITTNQELARWLTAFVQERIEDENSWDIREGILSLGGELFKERNKQALSMARSKEELGRIVGEAAKRATSSKLDFQKLGIQAMELMGAAGITPQDFSNKSRSFALYFLKVATGEIEPPTDKVRAMSLTTAGWCTKGAVPEVLVAQLRPLLQTLCEQYDINVLYWNTADLLRENYRSFALLSDLYAKFQEICESENTMLLSETKYILSTFIGQNDAPFIYEKVGNRYDRFMIDEFQDTSLREWENFLPLLQNAMAQSDKTSVLIVGDIKQSIYRWRGGDWRILHEKAQQALGIENTEVINLQSNYRSLPAVVDFNNRMIGAVVTLANAELNGRLSEAVATGAISASLHAELQDTLSHAYQGHEQVACKTGINSGFIHISTFEKQPALIEQIEAILDNGFKPNDILILGRSSSDGAKIAATLLEFKHTNTDPRYHFDVMTQEALTVSYAPISSFLIAALYLTLDQEDTIHRTIYNHYLKHQALDCPLSEEEILFFRSIRLLSTEEAIERIIIRHQLQNDREQVAYLQALHEQVIAFCTGRVADIQLFLQWWDEQGQKSSLSVEQSQTTIEVTTIHKAKGLEKKIVIVPYCNWMLGSKTGGGNNFVWSEPQGDWQEVGCVPVKFKKEMAASLFSADYYREEVYAYVDNINLLYVALTRAIEGLYLFIPNTRSNIGALLLQCIRADGQTADLHGMLGTHTETDKGDTFAFGSFAPPEPQETKPQPITHKLLEHYPTSQPDLRLRLPSQRYFEENGKAELAPRNIGILMHRLFENARAISDIDAALEELCLSSLISTKEATTLRTKIDQALADPVVHSWFSEEWEDIRNENEIIIPKQSTVRRPDRVMIQGSRAVVVDYKFGEKDQDSYRKQILEYMRLLRQIGYTTVEGWLWYVKLGRTEQVRE